MLAVALKSDKNLRYVTEFLKAWNVHHVVSPIPGGQVFLAVDLDGMRKEVYESLDQLLIPFEPINISPLLVRASA